MLNSFALAHTECRRFQTWLLECSGISQSHALSVFIKYTGETQVINKFLQKLLLIIKLNTITEAILSGMSVSSP